jgi:hypothetical protein
LGDLLLDEPVYPPPAGSPKAYASSGGVPQWAVQQWNIPGGKLSGFVSRDKEGRLEATAEASAGYVKVTYLPTGSAVTLIQNGAVLPCLMENGEPRELDLFISPLGPHVDPPGKPGMLWWGPHNPKLSNMQHLVQQVDLQVIEGLSRASKGCKVNQGNSIIGIILSNTFREPSQTIFYQLKLSTVCGTNSAVKLHACEAPNGMHMFSPSNPFGTDDYLPLLGQPYIASGQTRFVRIDLLPRLMMVINKGPPEMDHDASHWIINSIYAGQHIWGDVRLQTTWTNFRLLAVTR